MENRRSFIKKGGLAAAGSIVLAGLGSSILASCRATKGNVKPDVNNIGWEQQPLPYAFNALEPYIDAATMEIHYSRHAASYTKNMKDALAEEKLQPASVTALLAVISKYSPKLRNNAGGHYNHEHFWQSMTPGGKAISTEFTTVLEQSFGSVSDFKNKFAQAAMARFGSGWAWLVIKADKQLAITSTQNQDNPLMDIAEVKGIPLLGIDVWEHAYYLKYQNKRADYIANWWNLVNWEKVEARYKQAI
jgi:Fe-Mn family superoxide dismutase